ncbi:MAG: rhodanese-like domain-containing protein [Armatimonadota bacterium]
MISLVLRRAALSRDARVFIGWFGPRGLNSLLLVLLAVHAHVADAERLMAITGGVVIVSIVLHGVSATPLSSWYAERASRATLPEERESTPAGLFQPDSGGARRISAEELYARMAGPTPPPVVLDVRSRSGYYGDRIPGSIHVYPDELTRWAAAQPREREVVAYCT